MPVFIKGSQRVLYVHVPKTGGTAVEFFFEKNGWDIHFVDRGGESALVPMMKCSPQHMHAQVLQDLFRLRQFTYIFMTVRDPVARLVSEYRMRAVMQKQIAPIDDWIDETLNLYPDNKFLIDNHIRPQADFWLPGCTVFRHEDGFGADWVQALRGGIGCDFAQAQVEVAMRFDNAAPQTPSAASVLRTAAFYAQDYELFGYRRPQG